MKILTLVVVLRFAKTLFGRVHFAKSTAFTLILCSNSSSVISLWQAPLRQPALSRVVLRRVDHLNSSSVRGCTRRQKVTNRDSLPSLDWAPAVGTANSDSEDGSCKIFGTFSVPKAVIRRGRGNIFTRFCFCFLYDYF